MYQNLRSVGLPARDANEVCSVALSLESIGTLHPTESGVYRHVGPDLGVELWIHYDLGKKPIGIVPHFIGSSRLRCHVGTHWSEPIDPLLGFVVVQVQPLQEGNPYPLVLSLGEYASDLPFLTLNEGDKSQTIEAVIQIAAFANEVKFYKCQDEFDKSDDLMKKWGGAPSVFPYGLFDAEQIRKTGPRPMAAICGIVESCERRKWQYGLGEFWWLSLRTLHGWIDVLIAPDLVNTELCPGMIVSGDFWLNAAFMPNLRSQVFKLPRVDRPEFRDSELVLISPRGRIDAGGYLTKKVRALRSPSVLAISATVSSLLCMPVAPFSLAISAFHLWKQRKSQKWLLALNAGMTLVSAAVMVLLIKVIMAIAKAAVTP